MLSKNALSLLEKRYFLPGETWEGLIHRVVTTISKNRKTQEKYATMMYNLDFLPNTPCLINAGARTGQLMACFVLPIEDDMDSIFDGIKHAALIHKSGGGTGFSFSRLREAGAKVASTEGISSGPVSFMRVYNEATGAVKQGGVRRGANMGILSVTHPDIREFITCKKDLKQLTNFNISVAVSTDFMEAYRNDEDYALISPHSKLPVKTESAREIMRLIAQCAHENGEPGVVFIDEINKYNPTPHLGTIEATNPCFSGDMELLTARGPVAFKHLRKEEQDIVGADGIPRHAKIQKTGVKQCIELILSDNEKIVCTPEHIILSGGLPAMAKNMLFRRMSPSFVHPVHSAEDKFLAYGFAQGDGNLTRLNSERHSGIEINIGAKDADVVTRVSSFSSLLGNGRKRYWPNVKEEMLGHGFCAKILPERIFPKAYYRHWSFKQQRAFLCGCFSANGSVIGNARISYKTTSIEFAKQLMWTLEFHGIKSYMTTNKAREVEFPNGSYLCRESYDVNISQYESIALFSLKIGFIQHDKTRKLDELLGKRAPKVISINYLKEPIDVYDFSLDEHHWGIVNGFIVHNCGEQPLLPYEACVLGSINLANMVKDGKVNEEKLTDTAAFATLFLDDVITTSIYPLERVKTMVTATRKIGLGVMGWADMLAQLSIPYDSPEAIQLSNQVMELISITAKEVSNVLGEQMLPYPANKSYIQCRNATVTTIAPTGSISMIADCSSGIEPYFSLAYTKTVLDGEEFKYINPYLQKVLTEKGLWNDKVEKTVLKTGSIQGIAEIPEDIRNVFKIAKEISPTTHIDMQAEFQKNVDNAVSKTINLPKSATVEEIEQIYLHAYETKCKGITVYRDGSRDVQVLSIGYSAKSGVCPECGSKVDHAEGCVSCKACGWAVCE